MKKTINTTHIEGLLYNHTLEVKTTGAQSKNPGTQYIAGNVEIATDNGITNIVTVHFSFVTPTTKKGTANATYAILNDIISGRHSTVIGGGADTAAKLRIDSSIDLNEFYTERDGKEELVSAKRNEGGFIHVVSGDLNADENARSTFEADIIIKGTRSIEADPKRNLPEKLIIQGVIFNYAQAILPVEFSVVNPNAIKYFEGLGASNKTPVFTKVKGRQISETIKRTITEESAFGEASVREVSSTRKDYVVTWAQQKPYDFDDENSILASELVQKLAERDVYLAAMKKRSDEYKASKTQSSTPAPGGFNF
jgi:hypothetical protein